MREGEKEREREKGANQDLIGSWQVSRGGGAAEGLQVCRREK